jgi:hypothetical protein
MKKTIIILALALAFAIPAFADEEIVINNDNIGRYSGNASTPMSEEQYSEVKQRRAGADREFANLNKYQKQEQKERDRRNREYRNSQSTSSRQEWYGGNEDEWGDRKKTR